jgi:hypothetical protein
MAGLMRCLTVSQGFMRPVHAPGPLDYRFLVPIAVIVAKGTQKLSTGEVCLRGRLSVKEVFRLWRRMDSDLSARFNASGALRYALRRFEWRWWES